MAELGDLQAPGWLQRNWAPKEPFDPTPWLQERWNRQIQMQKLPLELQQMELANKAHALAIEHQGMMNDEFNGELNRYQEDLPALQSALADAQKRPGGTLEMQTPSFRSKKAMDLWSQRQKADAETAYGQALHQRSIEDMKTATKIMEVLGMDVPRNEDGSINREMFTDLAQQADERKRLEDREDKAAGMEWHMEVARVNAELNKLKSDDYLAQRKSEQDDRRANQEAMMELRKGQQELSFEKVLQKDPEMEEIRKRKTDASEMLDAFKREKPGRFFGRKQGDIEKDISDYNSIIRQLDRDLETRERKLRQKYVPDRNAAPEAPAASPPDFDYDPTTRSLVKPAR